MGMALKASLWTYLLLCYCAGYGYSLGYGGGGEEISAQLGTSRISRYVDGNSQRNNFGPGTEEGGSLAGGLKGSFTAGLGTGAFSLNKGISITGALNDGKSTLAGDEVHKTHSSSGHNTGKGAFELNIKTDLSGSKPVGLGGLLGTAISNIGKLAAGAEKTSELEYAFSRRGPSQLNNEGYMEGVGIADFSGESGGGRTFSGITTKNVGYENNFADRRAGISKAEGTGITTQLGGPEADYLSQTSSALGFDIGKDGINTGMGDSNRPTFRKTVVVTTTTGNTGNWQGSTAMGKSQEQEINESVAEKLLSSERTARTEGGISNGFAAFEGGTENSENYAIEQGNKRQPGDMSSFRKEVRVTTTQVGNNRGFNGRESTHTAGQFANEHSTHTTSSEIGHFADNYDEGSSRKMQLVGQGSSVIPSEPTHKRNGYGIDDVDDKTSSEEYLTERGFKSQGSFITGNLGKVLPTEVRKEVIVTTSETRGDKRIESATDSQAAHLTSGQFTPAHVGHINEDDSDESIVLSGSIGTHGRKIQVGHSTNSEIGLGLGTGDNYESDESEEHQSAGGFQKELLSELSRENKGSSVIKTVVENHNSRSPGGIVSDNYEGSLSGGQDFAFAGSIRPGGEQRVTEEFGNRGATTFRKEVTVTTSGLRDNEGRGLLGSGRGTYRSGSQSGYISNPGGRRPAQFVIIPSDADNYEGTRFENYGPKVVTTTTEIGHNGNVNDEFSQNNGRRNTAAEGGIRGNSNFNSGFKSQGGVHEFDGASLSTFRKDTRVSSSGGYLTPPSAEYFDGNFARQSSSSRFEDGFEKDADRSTVIKIVDNGPSALRREVVTSEIGRGSKSASVTNTATQASENNFNGEILLGQGRGSKAEFLRESQGSLGNEFKPLNSNGETTFNREVTVTTVGGSGRSGTRIANGYDSGSQDYQINGQFGQRGLREHGEIGSTKLRKEVTVTTSGGWGGGSNQALSSQLDFGHDSGIDRDQFGKQQTVQILSTHHDGSGIGTGQTHFHTYTGEGFKGEPDFGDRGQQGLFGSGLLKGNFGHSGMVGKDSSDVSFHISGSKKGILGGLVDAISSVASPESKEISFQAKHVVSRPDRAITSNLKSSQDGLGFGQAGFNAHLNLGTTRGAYS